MVIIAWVQLYATTAEVVAKLILGLMEVKTLSEKTLAMAVIGIEKVRMIHAVVVTVAQPYLLHQELLL